MHINLSIINSESLVVPNIHNLASYKVLFFAGSKSSTFFVQFECKEYTRDDSRSCCGIFNGRSLYHPFTESTHNKIFHQLTETVIKINFKTYDQIVNAKNIEEYQIWKGVEHGQL